MRYFFGLINVKIQFQVSPKTGNVNFLTTQETKLTKKIAPAKAQRGLFYILNKAGVTTLPAAAEFGGREIGGRNKLSCDQMEGGS